MIARPEDIDTSSRATAPTVPHPAYVESVEAGYREACERLRDARDTANWWAFVAICEGLVILVMCYAKWRAGL